MTRHNAASLRLARLPGALLSLAGIPSLTLALTLALAACDSDPGPAAQAPATAQDEAPAESDSAETDPSTAFLEMAERHAARYLRASPETATSLAVGDEFAGGDDYNARLGDYGYEGQQNTVALNERFLEELRRFERGELSGTARVTYDVLRNAYETAAERNSFEFGSMAVTGSAGPYVMTQITGPHIGLPQLLLTEQPLETAEDAEDYLTRLEAMGTALRDTGTRLEGDATAGIVPPRFALEKIALTLESFTAAEPADHPLVTVLADKLGRAGVGEAARAEAVDRARVIVTESVYPAYETLGETIARLMENAGDEAGIWTFERGEAFYQHALNSYGANGRTADEIHRIGLDEVARIEAEMDAILTDMGLTDGTVGERFASIADDPANVYPNTDEGKATLLEELHEQVDGVMARAPEWFATLPPQAVEVRRIPVYEQDSAPGGYYTGPSLDGERPGIYWINLKNTADWPKHTLKTLTYHEAVPGHHFQIALQFDIENFPLMRNTFFYSQYSEGWALYAEKVAAEMGMYEDDPLGDLGRLQSELFRAVRLVVDTGLHDKRWTREEAIDYMVDTLGDTRDSVTREVERYAVWPGQATSYKLGMLKIEELREEAEAALGEDFDIRVFHDAILADGAMPLPVLDAKIERWIAEQGAG